MSPPAAAPPPNISEPCSDEELFMSLEIFHRGGPLPMNVMRGINPYHHKPEDLSVVIWYFVVLQNHVTVEHGAWKATGEPRRIFTNDSISGWRTTYEYRYQPSSSSSTADWLMQQHTITRNGKADNTIGEDASALCRVYRNCPSLIEQDLPQGHGLYDTSAPGNSARMPDLDFIARQGEASTSNHQANDIEAAAIVARDDPVNQENVPDAEWGDFERDYLELDDLGGPQSPSSSSGSSSCVTMSSNECSAPLVLQDTENRCIQDFEEKGHDHEFNTASAKPDGIPPCALPLGSSMDHAKEEVQNTRVTAASASSDKNAGHTLPKQEFMEEIQNPGDIPPVDPQSPPTPSPKESASKRKNSATERWHKGCRKIAILKKFCLGPF